MSAGLAGTELGRLLGIPASGPVLAFDRTSSSRGEPVEHSRSWYRADRYELFMGLGNDGAASEPARGVVG